MRHIPFNPRKVDPFSAFRRTAPGGLSSIDRKLTRRRKPLPKKTKSPSKTRVVLSSDKAKIATALSKLKGVERTVADAAVEYLSKHPNLGVEEAASAIFWLRLAQKDLRIQTYNTYSKKFYPRMLNVPTVKKVILSLIKSGAATEKPK